MKNTHKDLWGNYRFSGYGCVDRWYESPLQQEKKQVKQYKKPLGFYEQPRYFVPNSFFDKNYFVQGEPYYLWEEEGGGMFAILTLNQGDSLLFTTGLGPPWHIALADVAAERIYVGKIVEK